jgi:hypothetical protein
MSITFACGSCGKSFTVDDKFAGKKGKCKQCGEMMEIPSQAAAAAGHGPANLQVSPSRRAASPPLPPREDIYGLDDLPAQHSEGLPPGIDEVVPGSTIAQRLGPRSAGLYDPPKQKQKGSGGGSGVNMIVRIAIGVVLGLVGLGGFGAAVKSFRMIALNPGLSSRAELEKIMQDRVDLHLKLAKVLEGVTDVDSARTASAQASQKFREIAANLRKLKVMKGLQTDLDAIKVKYANPQLQAAQQVMREITRVAAIPGAGEALDVAAAADELDREEKGVPGLVQAEVPQGPAAAPAVPPPGGDPATEPPAPPVAKPAPRPNMNRPQNNRPKAGIRKGINRPNAPGPN